GRRAVKLEEQARMLADRVRKNFRKLHPRFERQGIGAFRLYDRDIPEVRAAVDWYEGHLVVAEYARKQTRAVPWLETIARAAAAGAAAGTTSVDASQTYLDWARDNLRLNRLSGELVRSGVDEFLRDAGTRRWTLCVLDPPSSSDSGGRLFDVQRDHRRLIER